MFAQSSRLDRELTDPSAFKLPTTQPLTPTGAGRKRSRDEAAPNLESDAYFPTIPLAIPESEEGWEYGEGMTLIRPNGFAIGASSQSGTWVDEKIVSQIAVTSPVLPEKPIIRSYKSQRLDLSATPAITEEVSLPNGSVVAHSPPKAEATEPTVDDFTLHLGIGWSRISNDEDIQAAARGWAKHIENHFPITEPEIRLQSKGLASYLVQAREGWFLFGDDLKQGRLVSTSLETTFHHLRSNPPTFDGAETMEAVSQSPLANEESVVTSEVLMNGALVQHPMSNWSEHDSGSIPHNVEVEMDMS